ncbi:PAS domain S-box protein [Deinococcus yavapaiensis]|uniref:histidine kinase n=1 Tax=Deinococcus yavapaiensis KR-236 TaxID=694435 RepID=A0A318SMQ7_9DEIO|nr:PAS domain S-box protein [Deinococcus yavapaiensis]PYE53831.1 PAS domain S-box-containing protein [Deinococcus yavapaiensis KR-236]
MPEQSAERLTSFLLDQLPLPACLSDASGRVVFGNAAFTAHVGLELTSQRGGDFTSLLHPDDREHARRVPRDGRSDEIELRVRVRDGAYRWHRLRSLATFDGGRLAYVINTFHDVHAFKQAEVHAHSLFQTAPQIMWTKRPDEESTRLNRAWREYTGLRQESDGHGWLIAVHPGDREHVSRLHASSLARTEEFALDVRLRRHDGVYRWHHVVMRPLDGGGWLGTATDVHDRLQAEQTALEVITERVEAERAHFAADERFRAVFENAAVGVARVSFEGERFLEVNDALCAILGYGREELLATPWTAITSPQDVDLALASFRRMAAGELGSYTLEKRFVHKLGHVVWTQSTLSLVRDVHGQPDYGIGIIEDTSERKVTEARVRANAETFTNLVQNNPFGIYVVDADFRLTEVSRGARKVFENVRPLLGRDFAQVLRLIWTEPFASEAISRFRNTLATGEPYVSTRTNEQRQDVDETEAYDWRIERLILPDGRFGVVCYFYDLSERLAWEAKLQASEARLTAALDALPVGVVFSDASGHLMHDNAAHRALWGGAPETTSWKQYGEWIGWWPKSGARIQADEWAMARALLHGETVRGELVEYQLFGTNERRFFLNNAAPVLDSEGRVIGAVIAEQDVTEQITAERLLRENAERVQLALSAGAILGTWFWDLRANQVTVDEGFAVNFGLDPALGREGLSAERILETVHPDDLSGVVAAITEGIARGGPYAYQYRVRRLDGRYYWIEANGRVDHAEDGTPLSFPGVLLDVQERRSMLAALSEREERLRLATQAASIGTWDYDLVAGTLQWDARTKELFGLAPQADVAYEATFLANLHPDDRDRVEAAVAAALDPGGAGELNVEYRAIDHEDGAECWMAARGRAFVDGGRVVRFIGTVIDITERKYLEVELARQNAFQRSLLDSNADCIKVLDMDAHLVWMNEGGLDVMEVEDFQMCKNALWPTFWSGEAREHVEQALREAREGHVASFTGFCPTMKGTPRWWHVTVSPIRDEGGNVTRLLGVSRDITELHAKEQALRDLTATLEARVAERTAELSTANEALSRSNEELERFAYITSHDLQEPIRTVSSFAGLLEKRYAESLDERGLLYLSTLVKGAERMKALVDDLLTFSRVHGDAAPLKAVDLHQPLTEARARLARRLADTRAQLLVGELPMVLGDGPQLAQLFQNLVSNAVKFQALGTTPIVRITAEREGNAWHVRVADNGIGIEQAYLERVFELFKRLHSHDKFEGTGLGLGICQKIVERHGGRIWAESTVGQGSTFHFTLRAVDA